MKSSIRKIIGVAACAALFAPSLYASCPSNTKEIVGVAGTVASTIPFVGPVVDAAASLGTLIACGTDGEVTIDVMQVIDIVRNEQDATAILQSDINLLNIQSDMSQLHSDMEEDPRFQGFSFDELTDNNAGALSDKIGALLSNIRRDESYFVSVMARTNNSRLEYDLSFALLMANYKLTLLRLSQGVTRSDSTYEERASNVANSLLDDIPKYQEQSDRIRDLTYNLYSYYTPDKRHTDVSMKREGRTIFSERVNCPYNYGVDPDLCTEVGHEFVHDKIEDINLSLDLQDQQLALLKAKAQALKLDAYADLSSVETTDPVSKVMIVNAHPNANNRCIFMRVGGLDSATGELTNGSTRLRPCDPLLSRQSLMLEPNGQIRTPIANLCLEATSSSNKVLFRECSDLGDVKPEQIWQRDGDRFKVQYNGQTRCLSPRPDNISKQNQTFRHVSCNSNKAEQRWYVFSPLENQAPDPSDNKLCVGISNEFHDFGFYQPALKQCDQFRSEFLWAQDALGQFRSLTKPTQVLMGFSSFVSLALVDDTGQNPAGVDIRYLRQDAGDENVYFVSQQDPSHVVFAEEAKKHALIFSNHNVSYFYGIPDDIALWKHFNGGNWVD